jgi:ferredoxin-NADP reductase
VGEVVESVILTPSARGIILDVPNWPGNVAGQHVDLRLTAEDGYQAVRSYSLATAGDAQRIELAVDRFPDGEVSPYLVDELRAGDQLELRGPLGAWFVWTPENTQPVQLIGGGSGIVPLMAMIRSHAASASPVLFKLLYSVRGPRDVFYADELRELAAASAASGNPTLEVTIVYTRLAPPEWPVAPGRLTREVLEAQTVPASLTPDVFVCGPTGFVEAVATWLVDLGHDADLVRTERFGGD